MSQPVTPMMKQYFEIKNQYKDCILFYRLGDFYEMFYDDAKTASEVLQLTLTGRSCGQEERAPMCGVPFHSAQNYIAKLVNNGYKVAICEQTEDPAAAKGIVKREVIRIITPGTATLDTVLDESENNFLASIYIDGENFGITFVDASTGEMSTTQGKNDFAENAIANIISCYTPSEVIINDGGVAYANVILELKKRTQFFDSFLPEERYDLQGAKDVIMSKFGIAKAGELMNKTNDYGIRSIGAALLYLTETQKTDLSHISDIKVFETTNFMGIDAASKRNLEITHTMRDKSKKGSLLWVLDKTKTSMGARKLKSWLEQPLITSSQINLRLDSVEELVEKMPQREGICESLKGVNDIERILGKVVYGSANARDLVSLGQSLAALPEVYKYLSEFDSVLLKNIYNEFDCMKDLRMLIESAFVENPPVTVKEGGMIKDGFDAELDRLKNVVNHSTKIIADLEADEREQTDIKNLKIGYNRVFGYYIEVSKSNIGKVPDHYVRKQTLANCERFITQELKNLENTILGARERVNDLEYDNFIYVRDKVRDALTSLQQCARFVSIIDVLCSFAHVAAENNYVKPIVDDSDILDIKDGRHPIVELSQTDALFVPNDTYLDTDENRFAIITGPNMAGKSTYMRQTAVIAIMAQVGSFVPASYCHMGVVDKVFTRVGASDDLAAGQSTFMVEMTEVANILKNATPKSLVILDEIGRGTSTFDGLSIAWSVVEHMSDKDKVGAKTLFATHYHELIRLENRIEGVKNYSIAVKKRGDDVVFLRKIVKGGTDDNFGIEVAKLAGVPDEVIERAKWVLNAIESGELINDFAERNMAKPMAEEKEDNTSFTEVIDTIKNYDVSTLTPIEALNEIYKLQKKVSELYEQN